MHKRNRKRSDQVKEQPQMGEKLLCPSYFSHFNTSLRMNILIRDINTPSNRRGDAMRHKTTTTTEKKQNNSCVFKTVWPLFSVPFVSRRRV